MAIDWKAPAPERDFEDLSVVNDLIEGALRRRDLGLKEIKKVCWKDGNRYRELPRVADQIIRTARATFDLLLRIGPIEHDGKRYALVEVPEAEVPDLSNVTNLDLRRKDRETSG